MEIKKASISPSIEQASSTDAAPATPAEKIINTGISSAKDSFQDASTQIAQNGGAVDPNALVQYVLRESYVQQTEDLRSYAEKVKFFNESKKEVRGYLEGLRNADANLKTEFSALQPGQKSNVFEAVARVIKEEQVSEMNEDKKYYLNKLQSMNRTAEAISGYMEKIVAASSDLATKKKDDDD